MKEMIQSIISNILIAFYQSFWFAVILSILFMFVWKRYSTIKEAILQWYEWFRADLLFRKTFFLVLYTVLILFRTLLNRSLWLNPVGNIVGIWGLYRFDSTSNQMVLTTEVPENLALFIPFTILLLWTYRERIIGEDVRLIRVLWQSTKIVFLFSFTIEFLQLFLRLGTWQLSDLFYNTLGGFIGGLIYWIGYKVKHRGSSV